MPEIAQKSVAPEGFPEPVEIVREARRLAADRPDYIYPVRDGGCVYVERGDNGELVGSCLLGKAMVNLGVPLDRLAEADAKDDSDIYQALTQSLGYSISNDMHENPVVAWLYEAQANQDQGDTWHEAVTRADGHFGRVDE